MYSKSLFSVINVLVSNREEPKMYFKFLLRFEKLILIMRVRTLLHVDTNIARNTSIDKLRSKNFNNSQNLSSDNFVHLLDDSNKLVDKVDTIGINEFVKKLKPKCIQIIDLLFFKGYTQQEASEELEIPLEL
jgi:RNA polymerase sigma-70 factor (ECF subfamily)